MTSGDIVRHDAHSQWGRGYLIGVAKASCDVFFQWGGRRTVEMVALQRDAASHVEAELFDLCGAVSSRSWARGHHTVYAIELDRAVWKSRTFRQRNPGGADAGCLYVGVTGLPPEERFARHRDGTQSGHFVRRHGRRLRLDLVEGFSSLPYRVAARMESRLAARLRSRGFAVWQN